MTVISDLGNSDPERVSADSLGQITINAKSSTRNLVLCFDGTNNEFGSKNTSIVRLVQALDQDPTRQLIFYDPGVGTLPEPGYVSALGKWISKVAGLAFGAGIFEKIGEAYVFLMEHWRPGDRVFMFGFSRGAYSARALASLLHMFGLLPTGNHHLLPYLLRLFRASRRQLRRSSEKQEKYWNLCDEFRETFSREMPKRGDRRFPVHFVGVFDTVSSVGWIWDPLSLPFTRKNPSISIVRHAVSIDERRCFFRQNTLYAIGDQSIKELWFAGVHSDVGGGYPETESGLWREAYVWMIEEAKVAGVCADTMRERAVLERSHVSDCPWKDEQHESLKSFWWIAEVFPKIVYHSTSKKRYPRIGMGRRRRIPQDAVFHRSVRDRIRDKFPKYAPPNLSPEMLEAILRGTNVDVAS